MTGTFTAHKKERLRDRISTLKEEAAHSRCPVCGRPTAAAAGKGLSSYHCRRCTQHKNRFGSYWKGNYSRDQLRPYRWAAERFIRAHRDDFWVAAALKALRSLVDNAGPVERVSEVLHFLAPPDKARAALARMRRAQVPPERLLAIDLAITGAVLEDPIGGGSGDEYRLCQVAKAAMRQASGEHRVYSETWHYAIYPRSSGLALRHLGRMLDACCQHVVREHLSAILALKATRWPQ